MTVEQVRKRYLEYFKQSPRNHAVIPSAPLVPENDPTTLFTGSGMQPFLPYLLGTKHPKGVRLVNSQKCFRAEDIEEVGDNRHSTFFEMLGNWSLGDYFKKEQLTWCFEFLTKEIQLDPNRLYVTVFAGDRKNNIPQDTESAAIWKELFTASHIEAKEVIFGSEKEGSERGMKSGERIFYYDAKKNWWSRSGTPENMPSGEPGGPDSEVFFDFGTPHDKRFGKRCHPNCDCGRFIEICNSVFMQYIKKVGDGFEPLSQRNVDFGAGLERLATASNNNADIFTIDSFRSIIEQIERWTGKEYEDEKFQKSFRIVADHVRGAIFMISDGVVPSNAEQGYLLRRLLRRAIVHADKLEIVREQLHEIVNTVVEMYGSAYPELLRDKITLTQVIAKEEQMFRKTLEKGMREFEKIGHEAISGLAAFTLFTTYGFPLELTLELALERGISVDVDGFQGEMVRHQAQSRAGARQKFKGGLADHSEKVLQYHTATHLLLAGLRKELGTDVHQAGSNITAERTRFDFSHPEKVDRDVLDRVEQYVNKAIQSNATVAVECMEKDEAERDQGIEGSFWEKYPDEVNVYSVVGEDGTVYSRELCGGPHVENTSELGHFKIVKEEAVSAGVRRIKATLE